MRFLLYFSFPPVFAYEIQGSSISVTVICIGFDGFIELAQVNSECATFSLQVL